MDRSLAALLGRPLGLAAHEPRRRTPRAAARPRSRNASRTRRRHPIAGAPVRAAGALRATLAAHRRLRRALICALLAACVLAGGWALLRHSSLVAVRQVRVSGVHGPEAHEIDAALIAAAQRMSTLDVKLSALRAAVAPFPLVREVRASASFPHALHVSVVEQPAVAVLATGSWRSAVAADGAVLGPALITASLPTLTASQELAQGRSVHAASLLSSLAVLGAAPRPLLKAISRVYTGPKGLTVAMRNGLLAYFGEAGRPHAKWIALVRVLADPGSAGASYVDVRLPERPAAGFPPGVTRPAAGSSGEAPGEAAEGSAAAAAQAGANGQEGTIEALASALGKAAGVNESSSSSGEEAGKQASAGGAKSERSGEGTAPGAGSSSGESREAEQEPSG